MGSFLIKAAILLLLAALFLAWALAAFTRAEDPNLIPDIIPVNETQLQWAMRVSTSMIYFMTSDVVNRSRDVLEAWHRLKPHFRLGSMIVMVLLALNLRYFFKERGRRVTRTVYCEIDNTKARPISGSYNRYRCGRGHQFSGEPHML